MGDGEASAPLNYWRTRLSLVYAEEAVELLRRDERTRTIKERLDGYRDTSVSTLMLIGAQNQVELNITGGTFWLDLTKIIIGVVITLFCLPFVGFPVYPLLQAEQQTCHLRSFGVQLSPGDLELDTPNLAWKAPQARREASGTIGPQHAVILKPMDVTKPY